MSAQEIGDYLEGFTVEEFLAPQGAKWSPEGHLRHLIKSVRAVTRGMGMPKILLGLLYGSAREGSLGDEVNAGIGVVF